MPVDAAERELDIAIEPSAETVRPGDTVTYTLTVRDAAGATVPAAEVSVAIVDKAVLSLAFGGEQPIMDAFYYERPLGVTTGILLVINQDRISQQLSEGAKERRWGRRRRPGGAPGLRRCRLLASRFRHR